MAEKLKPINFSRQTPEERINKTKEWLRDTVALTISDAGWELNGKAFDKINIKIEKEEKKIGRDSYVIKIDDKEIGKFNEKDEQEITQYLYDIFSEFTNLTTVEKKDKVQEIAITKSSLFELQEEIALINTTSQNIEALAQETNAIEAANEQRKELAKQTQELMLKQIDAMEIQYGELKKLSLIDSVSTKIQEIGNLLGTLSTLQEKIKKGGMDQDEIEATEATIKTLNEQIKSVAEDVADIYEEHEETIPDALRQFIETVGATAYTNTMNNLNQAPTGSRQSSSYGPNARLVAQQSMRAVPYDIRNLERGPGESGEAYFERMGYDMNHFAVLKGKKPRRYAGIVEKAAKELNTFHLGVALIQAEYAANPSLVLNPQEIGGKVPKEYRKVKSIYDAIMQSNEKIYDLLGFKPRRGVVDSVSPLGRDGQGALHYKWDTIMTAKKMSPVGLQKFDLARDSYGVTTAENAQQRYETIVADKSLNTLTHFKKMSIQELIAIERVATEHKDIVHRTLLKKLMSNAGFGQLTDMKDRAVTNPFEQNIVQLGDGNKEAGMAKFWDMFQSSYMNGGSIEKRVQAKYGEMLRITEAMHTQNMMNNNVDFVSDELGFADPTNKDALLTNAFIKVVADETNAPASGVKNIFSVYKGDGPLDPKTTADVIRDISQVQYGEVNARTVIGREGLGNGIRHGLMETVKNGNMKLETAIKIGNAVDTATRILKDVATIGMYVKGIASTWNYVRGAWSWMYHGFGGEGSKHKEFFKKGFKHGKQGVLFGGAALLSKGAADGWDDMLDDVPQFAKNWYAQTPAGNSLKKEQLLESGVGTSKFDYDSMVRNAVGTMTMADLANQGVIIETAPGEIVIQKDKLLELPGMEDLNNIVAEPGGEYKLNLLLNKLSTKLTEHYGTNWQTQVQNPLTGALSMNQVMSSVPIPPTQSLPQLNTGLNQYGFPTLSTTQINAMNQQQLSAYKERSTFAVDQMKKLDMSGPAFDSYFPSTQTIDLGGNTISMSDYKKMLEQALQQQDKSGETASDALKKALTNVVNGTDDGGKRYISLLNQVLGRKSVLPGTTTEVKLYDFKHSGVYGIRDYLHKDAGYMDSASPKIIDVGGELFDPKKHSWNIIY